MTERFSQLESERTQLMPRVVRLQLTTTILSVFAACHSGDSPTWFGAIDTLPSGVVHVFNPEQGLWGDRSEWRFGEIAGVGSRVDSGPAVFGRVTDLGVDTVGRVYVFDHQAQDVRVFDGDGSFIRTIGRPGHGPGEFVANGIEIDPSNRLWVFNQGNMRYSVFDSSGNLLMEPRRLIGTIRWATWISVFTRDGTLYDLAYSRTPTGMSGGIARYDTVAQQLVDTLPVPEHPKGTKLFAGTRTLTAGGWWQGEKHTYRVCHIDFSGDTLRIIERPQDAARLSGAERDSAERYERDLNRRTQQGEIDLETEMEPLFETLMVDDRSHLWVMLHVTPDADSTGFDVFDPLGRYLGQVVAPDRVDRMVLPIFRNGRIHYVAKDDLDVPYVVIAEIVGHE